MLFATLDMFAEQFVVGWYGLTAVEAMSCGLPVLAYLRSDLRALYDRTSFSASCPIVCATPESLVEQLDELFHDAQRRRSLGIAGRDYVQRYHSTDALAGFFTELMERLARPKDHRTAVRWTNTHIAPRERSRSA
jgi:glycosyltransferase involved in cell wall biosynthesis